MQRYDDISHYYMLFCGLVVNSHITGHKGGSNAAFFKGENKSPWYIVSFGMIGATISGVTFVSVPGMVRGMDMTYMQTVFGFFFGYMIVAHILLPLYYRLNLTSIYGYLGTRIGVNATAPALSSSCSPVCWERQPNYISSV